MRDYQQELAGILWRVECGTTYGTDAETLRRIIGQLESDIFNLTASISDALTFDYEVTFEEEDGYEQGTRARVFDGAGTAD